MDEQQTTWSGKKKYCWSSNSSNVDIKCNFFVWIFVGNYGCALMLSVSISLSYCHPIYFKHLWDKCDKVSDHKDKEANSIQLDFG